MLKVLHLLISVLFLHSAAFAQSDDDFLSDFGGDDFGEIESELELVTTNVIKEVSTDIELKKKSK